MSTTSTRNGTSQAHARPGRQRKPRKPPEPVHGTAKWLTRPSSDWEQPARLQIAVRTSKGAVIANYAVSPIYSDGGANFGGQMVGYRLEKEDEQGEVYDIDLTPPWGATCTCPDFHFRDTHAQTPDARECKHLAALRAALAALTDRAA